MASDRNDPRHEGFKAGGYFGGNCPYPPGSDEAAAWERGWAEGSKRRAGARHVSRHPAARWQQLLSRLRSWVPLAH